MDGVKLSQSESQTLLLAFWSTDHRMVIPVAHVSPDPLTVMGKESFKRPRKFVWPWFKEEVKCL